MSRPAATVRPEDTRYVWYNDRRGFARFTQQPADEQLGLAVATVQQASDHVLISTDHGNADDTGPSTSRTPHIRPIRSR